MTSVGFALPQVGAKTLTTYLSSVRRLLKDSKAQYYSDADLTEDINDARVKVAFDTACRRAKQQFSNTANTF